MNYFELLPTEVNEIILYQVTDPIELYKLSSIRGTDRSFFLEEENK